VFGEALSLELTGDMRRVVRLHDAVLVRARQAILCWSAAARQLGLVKDVRIMICKDGVGGGVEMGRGGARLAAAQLIGAIGVACASCSGEWLYAGSEPQSVVVESWKGGQSTRNWLQ
jgi:hypothetical protein